MNPASSLSTQIQRRIVTGLLGLSLATLAGCSGRPIFANSAPRHPGQASQASPTATSTDKDRAPKTLSDFSPQMRERIVFVQPWVDAAAAKHDMEASLINAVIWVESRFNPRAKSPAGARGLMQLMPATASALARSMGRYRAASYDPEFNISAGTLYLAKMRKRYDGDIHLALAAYNAGAGNVDKWMKGRGLPPRSQQYIELVMEAKARFDGVQVLPAEAVPPTKLAVAETSAPEPTPVVKRTEPEPEIVPEPPVRYDLDRVESTYEPKVEPEPPLPADEPAEAAADPEPPKTPAAPETSEPTEAPDNDVNPAAEAPQVGVGQLPSVLD